MLEEPREYFTVEKIIEKGKEVEYVTCNHCGYRYRPRTKLPKRCPRCQKDLWNWRERK